MKTLSKHGAPHFDDGGRRDGAPGAITLEDVTFRRMTEDDVPSVMRIEKTAFSRPWHSDTFRSLATRSDTEPWVGVTPEGEIAGYTVFWCVKDQAELANIAVAGAFQNRGIGSALLDKVVEVARSREVVSLYLEVRMSNERAHRMYLHRGFEQVGIRRGYYQGPKEDARVLAKRLDS